MSEKTIKKIDESIEDIREDNTSGSVDLAKKTAKVIIELLDTTDSLEIIKQKSLSLINAQPAMASIFNLVNNMFFTLDTNKEKKPKDTIKKYCKFFLQELKDSDRNIRGNSLELIKPYSKIITHSYSSTVLNTLLNAKKSGVDFSVICTESRPKLEGIQLAKKLGKNKIEVNLVVDSAIFSLVNKADLILVGGDAITKDGLVNKIGTMGIAITANNYNIPIYALTSTIKILPYKREINLEVEKNPDEVLKENNFNIKPINHYFDRTPLCFISGFVTEKKILTPKEIKEMISKLEVHKKLVKN